jgi:hypothetical protein
MEQEEEILEMALSSRFYMGKLNEPYDSSYQAISNPLYANDISSQAVTIEIPHGRHNWARPADLGL